MAAPSVGSVVLVRVPFSDLSNAKFRPGVVLANIDRGDHILCQVTSNRYADPDAIELSDKHFESGSLQRISYIRPGKVFTANDALIVRTNGHLRPSVRMEIVDAINAILRRESE